MMLPCFVFFRLVSPVDLVHPVAKLKVITFDRFRLRFFVKKLRRRQIGPFSAFSHDLLRLCPESVQGGRPIDGRLLQGTIQFLNLTNL